jgi:hypothetical protein
MSAADKAEIRMLRESLERADCLTSAQVRTISALEQALAECQKSRDTLQLLAANQQRELQGMRE